MYPSISGTIEVHIKSKCDLINNNHHVMAISESILADDELKTAGDR
jgi:hypothetical protein